METTRTPEKQIQILTTNEIEASLPDYVRVLQQTDPRLYRQVFDLWLGIEKLTAGTRSNRLERGRIFRELRSLYSDRNIGGNRRTSGHGTFEKECLQRGHKPRTVRDLIADYEACLSGKPSTTEKRKVRHSPKPKPATEHPLVAFARLLPYEAALAAFRTAAKMLHPDLGGGHEQMQELNNAWREAERFYRDYEQHDQPYSAQKHIE